MLSPENAAQGMIARYSSREKAREMAHLHYLDAKHCGQTRGAEFWLAVCDWFKTNRAAKEENENHG